MQGLMEKKHILQTQNIKNAGEWLMRLQSWKMRTL